MENATQREKEIFVVQEQQKELNTERYKFGVADIAIFILIFLVLQYVKSNFIYPILLPKKIEPVHHQPIHNKNTPPLSLPQNTPFLFLPQNKDEHSNKRAEHLNIIYNKYMSLIEAIKNKKINPTDPKETGFDTFLEEIAQKAKTQEFQTNTWNDIKQSINQISETVDLTKWLDVIQSFPGGLIYLSQKNKVKKIDKSQRINSAIEDINKNQFNPKENRSPLFNLIWMHILQNLL